MLPPVRTEDFAADPQDRESWGTELRDLALSIVVVTAAALIAGLLSGIA